MATRSSARDRKVQAYVYDRRQLNLREVRALVKEKTGWDNKALEDAEHWYRNFLWLSYRLRATSQVVGIRKDADEFWHAHILDTEDYANVCQKILGRRGFLHHKPVRGSRAASRRVAKASQAAYQEEFPDEFVMDIHIGPFDIPCFWNIVLG